MPTETHNTILIIAKSPAPGKAKTRLTPAFSPQQAADLAAAALLDTLDAALALQNGHVVVALSGDLDRARRSADIADRLRRSEVITQRGNTFGERLRNAHFDTAVMRPGAALQIGMDTPQVSAELLAAGFDRLTDHDAVLGLATDGGWWALGLHSARGAHTLPQVPMSTPDTGWNTFSALIGHDLSVAELPQLTDVDRPDDIHVVARQCAPGSHFAAAAGALLNRTA